MIKKLLNYFSKIEWIIWISSIVLIVASFIIFDRVNYLSMIASLVGCSAILIAAKGNPFGELLMVTFAIIYGVISYQFKYYGELITYIFMTGPMSLYALISWLRHPYKGKKTVVQVNKVSNKEFFIMLILSIVVSVIFYFILKYFNTKNLIVSTISITSSFIAVYLSARRSKFYNLGYITNDIILVVLWILATIEDYHYVSMIICFSVFLINDIYSFISWIKMEKSQFSQN
jgi:nicotinamide mononucleotide transporter